MIVSMSSTNGGLFGERMTRALRSHFLKKSAITTASPNGQSRGFPSLCEVYLELVVHVNGGELKFATTHDYQTLP